MLLKGFSKDAGMPPTEIGAVVTMSFRIMTEDSMQCAPIFSNLRTAHLDGKEGPWVSQRQEISPETVIINGKHWALVEIMSEHKEIKKED